MREGRFLLDMGWPDVDCWHDASFVLLHDLFPGPFVHAFRRGLDDFSARIHSVSVIRIAHDCLGDPSSHPYAILVQFAQAHAPVL